MKFKLYDKVQTKDNINNPVRNLNKGKLGTVSFVSESSVTIDWGKDFKINYSLNDSVMKNIRRLRKNV